ncbi:MAG: TonB family protein [Acidobacteriota bacterium]
MQDNMFRDVVDPSISVGGRRGYTVPFSIAIHTLIVIAVIAFPLVIANGDKWPTPPTLLAFVGAPPPPPPAPAPPRAPAERSGPAASPDAAPVEEPHQLTDETPHQSNRASLLAVEGNGPGESIAGVGEPAAPAPPPEAPPPVATREPIRVGGGIKPPVKTREVSPVYPPLAQTARVQGVVIIEAVISPAGKVLDARILRSIPMLDAAALDAVRQWEYTPTLLNDVPVPVIMTVTVSFQLR